MKRPWIAVPLLCILPGCGGKKKEEKPAPVPVKVETVASREVRQTWRYSGEVKALTEVKLAFKEGGYVTAIHQVRGDDRRLRKVQPGDWVAAGTVLAQLRKQDYQATLTQAGGQRVTAQGQLGSSHADLEQAKSDEAKAKQDYDRAQVLYGAKAMTRPDYDQAVAAYGDAVAKVKSQQETIRSRQGQVETATGEVESASIALSDTNLVAPMPAVIVTRDVEPGTLVQSGTNAFTLSDTRVVKVEFGVPDSMLGHFTMGGAVPVTLEAFGSETRTGRITQVAASADRDSRVFNIQVSLPNGDGKIKLGMIASVEIQAGVPQVVPMIPVTALSAAGSGSAAFNVYVVRESDGKRFARLRSIRVGETVGRSITVLEGLTPGDNIIANRPNQLADGSEVQVTN